MATTHYPPTLQEGFIGAHPPIKSGSWDPTHINYFRNFRNENISRMQMPADEWGAVKYPYTPQPDIAVFGKLTDKYFTFPRSEITMQDRGRQQEIDDIFLISQKHRDQYKDHSGKLHPFDYFKKTDYTYQCPPNPTDVYMKYPTYYTKYRDPVVYPLTLERSYRSPSLPERALTGIYQKNSVFIRRC